MILNKLENHFYNYQGSWLIYLYRYIRLYICRFFVFIFFFPPEAIVCWFSETWVSCTPDRLESFGWNRTCPRRRPLRPKPATARRWGLCKYAGRPVGTAQSRTIPTGTIGHSEHTIFALRFTHLQHTTKSDYANNSLPIHYFKNAPSFWDKLANSYPVNNKLVRIKINKTVKSIDCIEIYFDNINNVYKTFCNNIF